MIFQNFGFNKNYPVAAPLPPEPTSNIRRLAVSSSLWAYYDIAFTSSYSSSGQTTVFDLSGNNNNGSIVGTVNYNTSTISGSVLRLGASSDGNRVQMPSLTATGLVGMTFTIAYYIQSGVYGFGAVELFGDRDASGDYYGIFALNDTDWDNQYSPSIDNITTYPAAPNTPVNSASSGSWHISQFSFNDSTNVWNTCADGVTGSYTQAAAFNGVLTNICFNHNPSGLTRYLNSGSMVQVMAVYTGSLSTQQLLDNHNSLKLRYGL